MRGCGCVFIIPEPGEIGGRLVGGSIMVLMKTRGGGEGGRSSHSTATSLLYLIPQLRVEAGERAVSQLRRHCAPAAGPHLAHHQRQDAADMQGEGKERGGRTGMREGDEGEGFRAAEGGGERGGSYCAQWRR